MRALPGPSTPTRTGTSSRAGDASGWEPQPRLWALPLILAMVPLGVGWLIDTVSARLGAPTHYLPVMLLIVALAVAVAAALFCREVARSSTRAPANRLPSPEEREAAETASRLAAEAARRAVTVTTQVRDIPAGITDRPAVTYPLPDVEQVVDAEIVQ